MNHPVFGTKSTDDVKGSGGGTIVAAITAPDSAGLSKTTNSDHSVSRPRFERNTTASAH
jgi:hypothetical protein